MDPESPLYLKSLRALQTHPQTSILSASYMDMDTEKSPHTDSHTDEGERGRGRRPFHPSRLVGYSTISLTPNTPAGRRNRPFIRIALGALVLLFVVAGWSGWAWERESLGQGLGLGQGGQEGGKGNGGSEGWVGGGSVLGPWIDDGGAGAGAGAGAGTGAGEGEGVGEFAPVMVEGMGAGQEDLVHVDAMGMERQESPGFAGYDGGSELQTVDVAQVEDNGEHVDDLLDEDEDDDNDAYNDDMDDDGNYDDMDDDDYDDPDDGAVTAGSPTKPVQAAEQRHGGPALGEAPVLDTIGMEVW
jgi:hypothetical protein